MHQLRNQGNERNQERLGNDRQERYDKNDDRRNRGYYRQNNGNMNLVDVEVVTKSRYEHRVIDRN